MVALAAVGAGLNENEAAAPLDTLVAVLEAAAPKEGALVVAPEAGAPNGEAPVVAPEAGAPNGLFAVEVVPID